MWNQKENKSQQQALLSTPKETYQPPSSQLEITEYSTSVSTLLGGEHDQEYQSLNDIEGYESFPYDPPNVVARNTIASRIMVFHKESGANGNTRIRHRRYSSRDMPLLGANSSDSFSNVGYRWDTILALGLGSFFNANALTMFTSIQTVEDFHMIVNQNQYIILLYLMIGTSILSSFIIDILMRCYDLKFLMNVCQNFNLFASLFRYLAVYLHNFSLLKFSQFLSGIVYMFYLICPPYVSSCFFSAQYRDFPMSFLYGMNVLGLGFGQLMGTVFKDMTGDHKMLLHFGFGCFITLYTCIFAQNKPHESSRHPSFGMDRLPNTVCYEELSPIVFSVEFWPLAMVCVLSQSVNFCLIFLLPEISDRAGYVTGIDAFWGFAHQVGGFFGCISAGFMMDKVKYNTYYCCPFQNCFFDEKQFQNNGYQMLLRWNVNSQLCFFLTIVISIVNEYNWIFILFNFFFFGICIYATLLLTIMMSLELTFPTSEIVPVAILRTLEAIMICIYTGIMRRYLAKSTMDEFASFHFIQIFTLIFVVIFSWFVSGMLNRLEKEQINMRKESKKIIYNTQPHHDRNFREYIVGQDNSKN